MRVGLRSKEIEDMTTVKTALAAAGTIGFWALAYLCAWVYPRTPMMTDGMGLLLFLTGAIMFLLSAGCLGHLVCWQVIRLRRELREVRGLAR
jgi:hypothetical protein